MKRSIPSLMTASALLLYGQVALGQDAAAAEALFDEGLAAMKAGDFQKACPKISESFRLEARPGTLFTVAECWRKAGKTATALARYNEYLRVFERMTKKEKKGQRGRDKFAKKHAAALKKSVPRLVVRLAKDAPAGTTVKRDGTELGAPSLGTPLPVDPGEHVITARADNGATAERTVAIKDGETREVTLQLTAPAQPEDVTPAPVAAPVEQGADEPQQDKASDGSGQRTTGLVLMGVGAAGVVVGTVTGLMVLGKKGTIEDNCGIGGDETACSADGVSEADSAKTLALVSTIGFGVGIAGLGAGATLFFTAPKPSTARRGSPGGASVTLAGTF